MHILVTAATKYGSTAATADRLAEVLRSAGHEVTQRPPGEVDTLDGVDAVVLGSAVYAGTWLPAARELAHRLEADLAARGVWLFSSGPLGDPRERAEDVHVSSIATAVGAYDHRVFPGAVDPAVLDGDDRATIEGLHAPVGDFRDWAAVDAYAREIADGLVSRDLVLAPTLPA
ncbi:flavodoxin domain-containing protein [Georgenia muralis]